MKQYRAAAIPALSSSMHVKTVYMAFEKIDAHQHFWQFDPTRDTWIDDAMMVIQKDFFPADLVLPLKQAGFDGCVTVQSAQSAEENRFQLANAANHAFIKGVVGWVDLVSPRVEADLAHWHQYEKLKGFRHVLEAEPQRDLMLQPAFMNGISHLHKYNFTYDILIRHDQLPYLPAFVSAFPNQRFVLDHLGKPGIKKGAIDQWKKDMASLQPFDNLSCKISGMVTEADWHAWKKEDLLPYMEVVVELFGIDRVMFGSDWPVCLLAATYAEVVGIAADYFSAFSNSEQEKVFGLNATRFYNL